MIDFNSFVKWAENKFDDCIISGKEVKLNSIFQDDDKFHLWCNPLGGKHRRSHGVYHCFKSGKVGTLVGLVMLVDGCSYEEALEVLGFNLELHELESKIYDFIFNKQEQVVGKEHTKLTLPLNSVCIENMSFQNKHRIKAEQYLLKRKIPIKGFYYCSEGKYRERIVIPYYSKDGELIYWNTRYIGQSKNMPKYLGPGKDVGVGKSDVVYMTKWVELNQTIHLTEGEFDAVTLHLCGFNSAAIGGSDMGENQFNILKDYKIVICGDNDSHKFIDTGMKAVCKIGDQLLENGIRNVMFVRPPNGYKDWNELYVKFDANIVKNYISSNSKIFDDFTSSRLQVNKF